MNFEIETLCKQMDFRLPSSLKEILIESLEYQEKSLKISFNLTKVGDYFELINLLKALTNFSKTRLNSNLECSLIFKEQTEEEAFYNYFSLKLIEEIIEIKPARFLTLKEFKKEEGRILLTFNSISVERLSTIKAKKTAIIASFESLGFKYVELEFNYQQPEIEEQKQLGIANNGLTNQQQKGKIALLELGLHKNEEVTVEGLIFAIDTFSRRGSPFKTIIIKITDFKEAAIIKLFRKENFTLPFQNGDSIRVLGKVEIEKKRNTLFIIPRFIELCQPVLETIKDNASQKLIEFSARTIMSTMDGLVSASDYALFAKTLGHKAIGIADINSVQSFPELALAAKKYAIKPIYGVTLSSYKGSEILGVINRKKAAFKGRRLKYESFVILDIETTGLSPIYDDIIEFGAVKMEGGEMLQKEQFFLKPNTTLPQHIIELTNITPQLLREQGLEQEQGLKRIIEFCGDSILVAHNAKFDLGFLYEKTKNFPGGGIKNLTVDTLWISRFLNPTAKRHSLEKLAQRIGINYDPLISHRADYDAKILAEIWAALLFELETNGIKDITSLENLCKDWKGRRAFLKDVAIIAKNKNGLKELYKIITKIHTQNFFGECQYDVDNFQKGGDLLLLSSGANSLLYESLFKGCEEEWREELKRYDVIQIIPPRNLQHLISREELSLDQIKDGLKKLILAAKKEGIPFIATAEPCYIYKHEQLVHKIYINTKGINGARHRLFKYTNKQEKETYPLLNFLTTSEMEEQFSFLEDKQLIAELVFENAAKIEALIETFEIFKSDYSVPKITDSAQLLKTKLAANLKKKYGLTPHPIIETRLKRELEPIINNGFDGIYWVSHLLVQKSLSDGFVVGSRGSVGSSLVAFLLGITEVNPLSPHYVCLNCKFTEFPNGNKVSSGWDLEAKDCPVCAIKLDSDGHNIPFETFLGLARDKLPDIDLNFSGLNQAAIHEELRKIFGYKHTFRAGTISTNAQRMAYGFVMNYLENHDLKISNAYIDYLVYKAVGIKRTTGQHPGGIVVIPQHLEAEDFTPLNYPANDQSSGWLTTHFDFGALESSLLKIDILGHDDPTAIKMLTRLTGIGVDKIPKQDAKVLSLFYSIKELGIKVDDIGEITGALGLPEFGSKLTRQILENARVSSFSDLISISGLSHGTNVWKDNAEILIKERGLSLKEVISCRDDIMIYLVKKGLEEEVAFKIMDKVRKGGGVTLEEEREMLNNGVEGWYIESLKKITYMFPKAHATAYVIMAWRIAWYKLYHPLAFYATYFTTRAQAIEYLTFIGGEVVIETRLNELRKKERSILEKATPKEKALVPVLEVLLEMHKRGIGVTKICLKKSLANEWGVDWDNNKIIPPFTAIDGLGIAAALSIVKAREEAPFSSVTNFAKRTSVNKTLVAKLKLHGLFEELIEDEQLKLF